MVKTLPSHFRGSNPWLGNCILCGMPPLPHKSKKITAKKKKKGAIEGAQGIALHYKQSDGTPRQADIQRRE